MLLKKDTIEAQKLLAKYCRDGEIPAIDGAMDDRLTHYRRLVYNVMYGLIEKAFPVTKSLLSEEDFKTLVNNYLSKHDAQIPQVWKVPGEFYTYFAEHPPLLLEDHPYLLDLLKMEWMEILVYNRENRQIPAFRKKSIEIIDTVVLNPDYDVLTLKYPVFKGEWDDINEKEGDYYLLLFRNINSYKVHFLEITALHISLIEGFKNNMPLEKLFVHILASYNLTNEEGIEEKLLSLINRFHDQGLVLGVT